MEMYTTIFVIGKINCIKVQLLLYFHFILFPIFLNIHVILSSIKFHDCIIFVIAFLLFFTFTIVLMIKIVMPFN